MGLLALTAQAASGIILMVSRYVMVCSPVHADILQGGHLKYVMLRPNVLCLFDGHEDSSVDISSSMNKANSEPFSSKS